MKVFIFLLFIGVFISSCDKEDQGMSDTNCIPVIISTLQYSETPPGQVNIVEAEVSDDCLTVSLGVGGCDVNHTINMISDGGIDESFPSQITFDFKDEQPQLCQAYFVVERKFDLLPIRDLTDEDLIIRFRNSAVSVMYIK